VKKREDEGEGMQTKPDGKEREEVLGHKIDLEALRVFGRSKDGKEYLQFLREAINTVLYDLEREQINFH